MFIVIHSFIFLFIYLTISCCHLFISNLFLFFLFLVWEVLSELLFHLLIFFFLSLIFSFFSVRSRLDLLGEGACRLFDRLVHIDPARRYVRTVLTPYLHTFLCTLIVIVRLWWFELFFVAIYSKTFFLFFYFFSYFLLCFNFYFTYDFTFFFSFIFTYFFIISPFPCF